MQRLRNAALAALSLALAASVVPAHAQQTLTVADVLQRAAGARGRLDPNQAFREVSTQVEDDITTGVVTDLHGSDYLTLYSTGDFVTAQGSMSGQGWYQDENGVVFLSSGIHGWDDSEGSDASSAPSAQPATLVHDAGRSDYAVTFTNRDGSTKRVYYDATTFLPERSEITWRNGAKTTMAYSDYRTVGGLTVAFHRVWKNGLGGGSERIQSLRPIPVAEARIGVPVNAQVFVPPGTAPFNLTASFDRDGTKIIVPVTIQGHTMDFVLDSGADGMTIDPGAAKAAGLEVVNRHRTSIFGELDEAQTVAQDVSIGGMQAKRVVFDVLPISQRYGDSRAVGLIGSDFFASNILRIDYTHKSVTVYPSGTFDPKSAGSAMQVQLDDGVIRVPVWIQGTRGNFLLDTGSFGSLLDRDFGTKIGLGGANNYSGEDVIVAFLGGDVNARYYDVKDIVFGGTRFQLGRVLVANTSASSLEGYDGLLGADILRAFAITFDYDDGVIYVK